ncbi:MAG: DNA internalization-related competence protein ComEC/Rec2 [Candidatus Methylomirabilota bacterium]
MPLAVAFTLGIGLEHWLEWRPLGWTAALGIALVLGGGVWWAGVRRAVWPVLILGFVGLGGQAMAAALFGAPPNHLSRLSEASLLSPAPLEGWVVGPPDPRPADARDLTDPERTRFVVEVTRLRLGEAWVVTRGRARLTVLGQAPEVAYGDEVRGTFRLHHPRRFGNPGAFDYPGYLATQGIFLEGWTRDPVNLTQARRGSTILAAVFHVRALLLRRLDAALPPQQAALVKAMVLGDRSGLTPEMNQAFLDSGTYHILAISGLNVSLLAGTLFGLFRLLRASPRLAAAGAAILVTLYAALAGASASVIRAAVMTDVYLLAVVLDRRGDLLNSLALSALALLWWNPRFLSDVGFQLTFLATLGIVAILPRCEEALTAVPRALRWPVESVAITVAATVMTLPILAGTFNRVAPVGILANLPIVPLSGLVTALGTAACALLLATPAGLPWLNQANAWLVDLLFATAGWFAAWPWSTVRVYTPTAGMLAAYYAIGAACVLTVSRDSGNGITGSERGLARARRWARRLGAAGVFMGAVALVVQVGVRLWPLAGPPAVRITLLDVGQGEAHFVELRGGQRILVDAGGVPGGRFDIGARVVAPFLLHQWVGSLDVLVLTHAQADHIGGVPAILRGFPVGEVWSGDTPYPSITFLWVQEYLRRRKIPHRIVSADSPPIRWGEATVEVRHPPSRKRDDARDARVERLRPNDTSMVLRLRIGEQAALLTGDVEREGETALLRRPAALQAKVLKVPHHGSRTSSSEAFLAAVRPEVALVSCGYRNRFNHPHPEVVERYRALGVRLYRTDLHGAINVEMRPEGIRVWSHRGP